MENDSDQATSDTPSDVQETQCIMPPDNDANSIQVNKPYSNSFNGFSQLKNTGQINSNVNFSFFGMTHIVDIIVMDIRGECRI